MNHLPLFSCATLVAFLSAEGSLLAQTEVTQSTSSGVEISARTRALFRKGLAAYNAGQVDTARQLFLQAWEIRPSADVAMELAQTEMDLGRYVEAAEHLEYALRNFTPSINEKMRNIARQAHSEVRRHVARLNVEVDRQGAEVILNGRVVGMSPLTSPLYAEPGNCVVQARLGRDIASQTLLTGSGKDFSVRLTLALPSTTTGPLPVADVGQSEPRPFDQDTSPRRDVVPVAIGGTLAVAGIVAGIGLRLAANSEEDNAKRLSASLGGQSCTGANTGTATCSALRDSVNKSDSERNWSTACLVVGSAALVATATYWLWPRKKSPDPHSQLRVSAGAGPTSAGLLVSGGF